MLKFRLFLSEHVFETYLIILFLCTLISFIFIGELFISFLLSIVLSLIIGIIISPLDVSDTKLGKLYDRHKKSNAPMCTYDLFKQMNAISPDKVEMKLIEYPKGICWSNGDPLGVKEIKIYICGNEVKFSKYDFFRIIMEHEKQKEQDKINDANKELTEKSAKLYADCLKEINRYQDEIIKSNEVAKEELKQYVQNYEISQEEQNILDYCKVSQKKNSILDYYQVSQEELNLLDSCYKDYLLYKQERKVNV